MGEQRRSKLAVLNSAVSGGLNGGVAAGEKRLIKLDQMSFKTQLTRYSRDVFNSQTVHCFRLLLFTLKEDLIVHVSALHFSSVRGF